MTSNYSFDNLKLSMPFLKRESKTLGIEVRDFNKSFKEGDTSAFNNFIARDKILKN